MNSGSPVTIRASTELKPFSLEAGNNTFHIKDANISNFKPLSSYEYAFQSRDSYAFSQTIQGPTYLGKYPRRWECLGHVR